MREINKIKAKLELAHILWSITALETAGPTGKVERKEAPVAPVRMWEAENVVCGQGPYVRGLRGEDSRVYFQDLSPEVQDALNGRKA